jgi:tetratricopeptide (TPR) repeat protein
MWEVAKDPAARERYRVHLDVERKLASLPDPRDRGTTAVRALVLDSALAELADADAENSPDVRLRFDLARVQYMREVYTGLIPLLRGALLQAPDHPQATQGYWMLALAYARADNTTEELANYELYLARESDPGGRATAIMNRAEGYMRIGRLQEAMDGYRETEAMGGDTLASSRWGLAVALDRYGDPGGALATARRAFEVDPDLKMVLDKRVVFFVPEYDRLWYVALGMQATAASASRASMAARALLSAELAFTAYLAQARAHGDAWIHVAEMRLASVKKKRADADARAAKETPVRDVDFE